VSTKTRGKRCKRRHRGKPLQKSRSPKSPGSSLAGAPRENQSIPEDRTSLDSTRGLQHRLQQIAMQYIALAAGLLRLWQALPPDIRKEIARLMHLPR